MNPNQRCTRAEWAAYVHQQFPQWTVPAEWISPRRLDLQRRGLKPAMTFGELQDMLRELDKAPPAIGEGAPPAPAGEDAFGPPAEADAPPPDDAPGPDDFALNPDDYR